MAIKKPVAPFLELSEDNNMNYIYDQQCFSIISILKSAIHINFEDRIKLWINPVDKEKHRESTHCLFGTFLGLEVEYWNQVLSSWGPPDAPQYRLYLENKNEKILSDNFINAEDIVMQWPNNLDLTCKSGTELYTTLSLLVAHKESTVRQLSKRLLELLF